VRSARIHEFGDPDVIRIDDIPIPTPGPDEVLIKVAATSFNPTEVAVRIGLFDLSLPHTLGWDVAGTTDGVPVVGWIDGAAAEYATAQRNRLVEAPGNIPLHDAAAIPLAGLTAWQMVFDHAQVQPGQRVLINGAGGGIGGFAVQLAKHAGAHVTATAGPRSVDAVRRQGADHIVGHQPGGEFDVVLNLVADAPLAHLGPKIVSATMSDVPDAHMVARFDVDQLTELVEHVADNTITVDISERHPLGNLADVHRRAGSGLTRGKVVVLP
jgi:NADPH:quinone reductase-like Zn-dependent oxidoreductase